MDEVLSEINFDEGIAMPVANDENKKIEFQLEDKQNRIASIRDEIDQYIERVQSMSDHLKNVRQERLQTQELCNARDREIGSEKHFRQLAEREDGRLRSEIQRLDKELEVLKERKNDYENKIFKGTEKVDFFRGQMNWDQQALESWLEESAKRDEDAMILEKYAKVDEGKIKELSLKQEKMLGEKGKKRQALEHEITQTLTAQLELDKVSETFREAHKARQELLKQWETTIKQMERRDIEMDQTSIELMNQRIEVKKRQESLKDSQQFLESELNNNEEKEKKISFAERQAAKLRLEYQNVENTRIQFQDELETLKYTVDRTAKDLENSRKHAAELKKELDSKYDKLALAKDQKSELQEQYKFVLDSKLTAEERSQLLEAALKKEEFRITELERELSRLRDLQFKKTQELYQVHQMETGLNAEIQGAKAASRNLTSKLYKVDQESLKQQEIVYNQDFQLQQLERKIARLQGERNSEEKMQLEKRIEELSQVLESHNSKHGMLTSQLKKLSDDLRRANVLLTKGSEEKRDLGSKIGELTLHNDSSERELKNITSEKQDLMVDENILKLEIKRLRDQLHSRANEVLTMEERRLLLDTAMKERRQEIHIHNDMLKAQLKAAEEERQKTSAELHERISKIEKLRKRYEILMVSMAPPEGEEEKSQAYYVIKAAQEKEELQRTGDELDAKIRKAEQEIRALENTLRLMNNRNETYRKSFSTVEESSEEYEQKMQLEEQLRVVMDKYKYKRRQIKELQEDIQSMQATADSLSAEEEQLIALFEEKEKLSQILQKDLDGQEEKKDRAEKMVSRFMKEIRAAKKSKGEVPEEEDIRIRELKDLNGNIMKQMGVVMHQNPDFALIITMYFEQVGLPVPPSPGTGSSRSSSISSSRSSTARSGASSVRSDVGSIHATKSNRISVDLPRDTFSTRSPLGTPPRTPTGSNSGSNRSTPKAASSSSNNSTPKATMRTPESAKLSQRTSSGRRPLSGEKVGGSRTPSVGSSKSSKMGKRPLSGKEELDNALQISTLSIDGNLPPISPPKPLSKSSSRTSSGKR